MTIAPKKRKNIWAIVWRNYAKEGRLRGEFIWIAIGMWMIEENEGGSRGNVWPFLALVTHAYPVLSCANIVQLVHSQLVCLTTIWLAPWSLGMQSLLMCRHTDDIWFIILVYLFPLRHFVDCFFLFFLCFFFIAHFLLSLFFFHAPFSFVQFVFFRLPCSFCFPCALFSFAIENGH